MCMVFLTNLRTLNKTPKHLKKFRMESNSNIEYPCFNPLSPSEFVQDLLKRGSMQKAFREMLRISTSDIRQTQLQEILRSETDVIFVSSEELYSPLTYIRMQLLDKWKVPYEVVA